MAKLVSSIGQLSGRAGGTVYGHNRYGAWFKQFQSPVNPQSSRQTAHRGRVNFLAQQWNVITEAERSSWRNFADGAPAQVDRMGLPIQLSGQAWYMKANLFFLVCSRVVLSAAPPNWQGSAPTGMDVTFSDTAIPPPFTQTVSLTTLRADDAGTAVVPAEHYMIVYAGPMRNQGFNFPGDLRIIDVLDPETAIPADLTAGYEAVRGVIPNTFDGHIMFGGRFVRYAAPNFYVSDRITTIGLHV